MSVYRFAVPSLLHSSIPTNGLREEMRRVLSDAMPAMTGETVPTVDARENATGFSLEMDLPGVAPESVEVLAEDGVLTVRGTRSTREVEEGEQVLFAERSRGSFSRRFRLPKSADLSDINATYAHGVLTVRIAKIAPAQPRRVPVTIDAAPSA